MPFTPISDWPPSILTKTLIGALALNFVSMGLLAILMNHNIDGVARNTEKIANNYYTACTELNTGFNRMNVLIDGAIADEEALPNPDQKRIKNLQQFKLPIRECGEDPSPKEE